MPAATVDEYLLSLSQMRGPPSATPVLTVPQASPVRSQPTQPERKSPPVPAISAKMLSSLSLSVSSAPTSASLNDSTASSYQSYVPEDPSDAGTS